MQHMTHKLCVFSKLALALSIHSQLTSCFFDDKCEANKSQGQQQFE
jgi:hypothetical protein